MKVLFKYVYFLIFLWFLQKVRARMSINYHSITVPVEDCPGNRCVTTGSEKYSYALVRKAGSTSHYWFLFRCREHVAVDICTELVRRNPELIGKMALHRYPCHCEFESIAGTLGWHAHGRIVSSMQEICRNYLKRHPGTLPDELPC